MFAHIQEALATAVLAQGVGIAAYLAARVLPNLAQKLANEVNSFEEMQHNAAVQGLMHEAVAYFKAHETEFAAQGVTMLDYAFAHVGKAIPGLDKTVFEHEFQSFLLDLSVDLK